MDPGQQQPAECRPDLSSLDEAQLAELLVLLQQQGLPHQQQLMTTDPADDMLPVMDGELLNAEQAIDAEISQLLALKQARLQQRRHNQLKLLQQLVAGRANAAVPVSMGLLADVSTPLQPQDGAIQLEQLQHQLPRYCTSTAGGVHVLLGVAPSAALCFFWPTCNKFPVSSRLHCASTESCSCWQHSACSLCTPLEHRS